MTTENGDSGTLVLMTIAERCDSGYGTGATAGCAIAECGPLPRTSLKSCRHVRKADVVRHYGLAVKLEELVQVPCGAVTLMGPVVAPLGTLVEI